MGRKVIPIYPAGRNSRQTALHVYRVPSGRNDKIFLIKPGHSRLNFSFGQDVCDPMVSTICDRTKQDEDGDNIRYFWCCYRPVYCFATKAHPMSSYSKSWSKSLNRASVRIGL